MYDLCKLEEMSACILNAPNCMRRDSMMSELVKVFTKCTKACEDVLDEIRRRVHKRY